MENKALYVLAGYDDRTEKYLSGIQEKLYAQGFSGVHTKGIPMHMTLGSFPCDKEGELKALVQKTAEEVSAFDVTFNHVGIFGGNVTSLHLYEFFPTRHILTVDLKES